MKQLFSIFVFIAIIFLSGTTYANNRIEDEKVLNNADSIFNWAESEYSEYFYSLNDALILNYKTINTMFGWVYRYYPDSGNAIAVYNDNVYVAGATWSVTLSNPIKVMSVSEALVAVEKNRIDGAEVNSEDLTSYSYLLGNSSSLFNSNSSKLMKRGERYFSGYDIAKKYLRNSSSSRAAWKKSVRERNRTDSSTKYGQRLRSAEHYLFTYSEMERFGYTNSVVLALLVDGYCSASGAWESYSFLRYYFNSYNRTTGSTAAAKAGCLGAAHSARRIYRLNN